MKRIDTQGAAAKRTQTLKSILQQQQTQDHPTPCVLTIDKDINTIQNSINEQSISEHQDGQMVNNRTVKFSASKASNKNSHDLSELTQSISLFQKLIEKEIANTAQLLAMDQEHLTAWIELQIEVPAKTIMVLLKIMQNMHLDPLLDEIAFTQYQDGHWQVIITVDGCAKLLNQHPQFNGLLFTQSDTLIEGVPEWIECAIYRRDRILPTTVREYLLEVKTEQAVWQKMPRRMLRHRALQQCVRLAMG